MAVHQLLEQNGWGLPTRIISRESFVCVCVLFQKLINRFTYNSAQKSSSEVSSSQLRLRWAMEHKEKKKLARRGKKGYASVSIVGLYHCFKNHFFLALMETVRLAYRKETRLCTVEKKGFVCSREGSCVQQRRVLGTTQKGLVYSREGGCVQQRRGMCTIEKGVV